jgi:hypothetical protein
VSTNGMTSWEASDVEAFGIPIWPEAIASDVTGSFSDWSASRSYLSPIRLSGSESSPGRDHLGS